MNPPVSPFGIQTLSFIFFLFCEPLTSLYQIVTNLGEFLAVKKGRDCDLDVSGRGAKKGRGNSCAKNSAADLHRQALDS